MVGDHSLVEEALHTQADLLEVELERGHRETFKHSSLSLSVECVKVEQL